MQKQNLKNLITKADIILAIVLLAIGLASPFVLSKTNKGGNAQLVVVKDGQEMGRYSMSEDFVIVFAEEMTPKKLKTSETDLAKLSGSIEEKKSEIERISLEYLLGKEIENVLIVSGKKATMVYANCDGYDCIKMGEIDKEGEFIACLPHKCMVYIEGTGSPADVIIK